MAQGVRAGRARANHNAPAMTLSDFPAGGWISDYLAFWAIWALLVAGTVVFFRRTRGRRGILRLVAGNLLVLVSLLWTTALAGETYFRYVYDQTDSYMLMLTNLAWLHRHVHLNAQGYRSAEFGAERRPGVARVAFVGDSFTMGFGVRDAADAFPQRVGAALEKRFPGRYEARNYGLPGFTTGHEARLIADLVSRREVDQVVLGYCLNDTDDLLPPGRGFGREMLRKPFWSPPQASMLADFVWFRLRMADDPRVKSFFDWELEAYTDPRIWSVQCERFRAIAETCRRAAVRLDVVIFPFFTGWGAGYRFGPAHAALAAGWKAAGIDVIDLSDAYRGIPGEDLMVNRFDAHPNERAHEIAARVVLDRVFDVR